MLLSLVDVLRCPEPHESSSLVLTVYQWSGQRVADGELGCPVCRARYPIRDGIADFTNGTGGYGSKAHRDPGRWLAESGAGDPERAVRLAAQLALGSPGGIVLLTGAYAALHGALLDLVDTTCMLVDAAAPTSSLATPILVRDALPLAPGVLRGAAVDEARSTRPFLADVTRCLAGGGRLVAPASAEKPDGVNLLASDGAEWVAEAPAVVSTVNIGRRSSV